VTIETTTLGRTGIEVGRLGLGTGQLGGGPKAKAVRLIHRALDHGVNYIDTARLYGDAEEKVGEVMRTRRGDCCLATKVQSRDAKAAEKDLATSLRTLGVDHVDIWLLHDISNRAAYEQVMGKGGSFAVAQKAKKAGKTRFIGITSHSMTVAAAAIRTDEFDVIMVPYNVMAREPETKVIPLAKKHDLGMVAMKANGGGIPFRLFRRTGKSLGRRRRGNLTVQDTLTYVLSNPDLHVALQGTSLIKELEENIRVAETYRPFTVRQRERLIQYADSLHMSDDYCINCGYCLPCPAGIPIPKIQQMFDLTRQGPWLWWEPHDRAELREEYLKIRRDASHCLSCGRCERMCPARLPVTDRLRQAKETFSK
jgi:predicted aldo/keto reductase-like oxidoreductase